MAMINSEKIGLEQRDIDLLLGCLLSNQHVKGVILFGSRAKGDFRLGSDIDLALEGSEITMEDMDRLASNIDDLLLPYRIDLTLINENQDEALKKEILEWGLTLV